MFFANSIAFSLPDLSLAFFSYLGCGFEASYEFIDLRLFE